MNYSTFDEALFKVEAGLYDITIINIQQYVDADASTIQKKIDEIIDLTGRKKRNVVNWLYYLAQREYPVHEMSLYQLMVAGYEIYWDLKTRFKEEYDLMDRIERGAYEQD